MTNSVIEELSADELSAEELEVWQALCELAEGPVTKWNAFFVARSKHDETSADLEKSIEEVRAINAERERRHATLTLAAESEYSLSNMFGLAQDRSLRTYTAVGSRQDNPYLADIQSAQADAVRADADISARKGAVATQMAMPDGSWMIRNRGELQRTIARYLNPPTGEALSDKYSDGELKRHIIKRARAMNLAGLLPPSMTAESIADMIDRQMVAEQSGTMVGVLDVPETPVDIAGISRDFAGPLPLNPKFEDWNNE
jgi:hypothetical protein